jgi:hypothetical protein
MVFGAIKSYTQDKWRSGTGAIKSFASDAWDKTKTAAIKYGPAALDVAEAVSGALGHQIPEAQAAYAVIKGARTALQPKNSEQLFTTPNKEVNIILDSASSNPEKKIEIINNMKGAKGGKGGKMMSWSQLKKHGRFNFGSIRNLPISRDALRDEWYADGTRKVGRK